MLSFNTYKQSFPNIKTYYLISNAWKQKYELFIILIPFQ